MYPIEGLKTKRKVREVKPPKGFDVSLTQFMLDYDLTEEHIKKLAEVSRGRSTALARATMGHVVYYRRRQLLEFLGIDIHTVPNASV
ncbi:hypothetical protein D3C75_499630 [compost metagenome]